MLETTIPEINVTELMERVRREASKIRLDRQREGRVAPASDRLLPVQLHRTMAALALPLPPAKKVKTYRARLETLLQRARQKNDPPGMPKFLRRIFRKQGSYNRSVLEITEILTRSLVEISQHLEELPPILEAQNQRLQESAQNDFDLQTWVTRATEKFSTLESRTVELSETAGEHLRNLQAEVDRLGLCVTNLQQTTDAQTDQLQRIASDLSRQLQSQFDRAAEHLRNLQAEVDRLGLCVTNLQQETGLGAEYVRTLSQRIADTSSSQQSLQQMLMQIEERATNDGTYIKSELSQQGQFIRELAQGRPATGKQLRERRAPSDHRLDAFYLSFENRFRGSRHNIKERFRFYLKYVAQSRTNNDPGPIVDLGCGRGEWLELLKDEGFEGRGVDLNSAMIALCKERKLDVVESDAVEYLRKVPEKSLSAITGFHIIEHLPLITLLDLVIEAFRALKPGGVLIFESPNCKNLVVGACNFYTDPTHRNPVFPEAARFFLEINGFERTDLQYLSPVEGPRLQLLGESVETLNELLYGPQDFAVIGYRPQ